MPPANGNDRFNAEAAAWDSNPDVHRASDAALEAILQAFPQLKAQQGSKSNANEGLDILEIGCGTGLLSFRMAPYIRSLVAVDASSGMIDALKQKLQANSEAPLDRIKPVCVMLEDPEDDHLPLARGIQTSEETSSSSKMKFDLILSHLVLHHIPDLAALLATMFGCLKPGGSIALTDYEDFGPEARKFHPEAKMAGVERHGISRADFSSLMKGAGFVDVHAEEAWKMRKHVERWPGEWGQKKPSGEGVTLGEMDFPFLLCRAKKP